MSIVIGWNKPFQFINQARFINYIDVKFQEVSKQAIFYAGVNNLIQVAGAGSPATSRKYVLLGIIKWLFADPLTISVEQVIEWEESRLTAPLDSYGFELWFQSGSYVDVDVVYGPGSGTGGGGMGDVTTAQLTALSDSVDTRFAAQAALIEGRSLLNHTHSQYVLGSDFSTIQAGLDSRIYTLETAPTTANGITNILSSSTYPSSPVDRELRNSNLSGCPTLLFNNAFAPVAAFRGRYRMVPHIFTFSSPNLLAPFQVYSNPLLLPGSATTQWMMIRAWSTVHVSPEGYGTTAQGRIELESPTNGMATMAMSLGTPSSANKIIRGDDATIRYFDNQTYPNVRLYFYSNNAAARGQVTGGFYLLERV